jgi:copper chaperone CopZ
MLFRIDNLNASSGPEGVIAAIKAVDALAWVSVDAAASQVKVESMAAADAITSALKASGFAAEPVVQRSGCCGGCGG